MAVPPPQAVHLVFSLDPSWLSLQFCMCWNRCFSHTPSRLNPLSIGVLTLCA